VHLTAGQSRDTTDNVHQEPLSILNRESTQTIAPGRNARVSGYPNGTWGEHSIYHSMHRAVTWRCGFPGEAWNLIYAHVFMSLCLYVFMFSCFHVFMFSSRHLGECYRVSHCYDGYVDDGIFDDALSCLNDEESIGSKLYIFSHTHGSITMRILEYYGPAELHCDNCASDISHFRFADTLYGQWVDLCSPRCRFTLAYRWAPRGKRHTWQTVVKYSVALMLALFTFTS